MASDLSSLTEKYKAFCDARDWEQFHSPKNLTMALSGEVGELTEIFQWLTEEQSRKLSQDPEKRAELEGELADIMLYLVRLADLTGVDLIQVACDKLSRNEARYPIEKAKGNAKKYTQF